MVINNSLKEFELFATLLRDVQKTHGRVFNTTDLKNTLRKCRSRYRAEGMSFLTKTLPRLGKAFDRAIAGNTPLSASELGLRKKSLNVALKNMRKHDPERDHVGSSNASHARTIVAFLLTGERETELPELFWEFTSRVLKPDGTLLQCPCSSSVKVVRQLCYLFYKYKLPYTDEQEHAVVASFEKTESDLSTSDGMLQEIEETVIRATSISLSGTDKVPLRTIEVAREARSLLYRLFSSFDPTDITPRHGPGVVATKQRLWGKFSWSNVAGQITDVYPFDAYFCASLGHVVDRYRTFASITEKSLPARVLLVPKDSRGPRLISCEPVDYQWIQQGLGTAIVKHVEKHWLTRDNVRFTDQTPNRVAALSGSHNGRYATLDLNEASDRVSLRLVRLLFPYTVLPYLEACRSSSTVLPDGRTIPLRKFAPMGSCLCFPVLSLVVWSLLTAGTNDTYTRERIYVYGDDVIVPTAYAANAMSILESFGLKINRDKSCTSGLFRESCGMDAFQGADVTPVRLRTVWSDTRSPSVYTSWIEYANSFYDRHLFDVYDLIVQNLVLIYGPIPAKDLRLGVPSLAEPSPGRPLRRRFNPNLQRFEYKCYGVRSPRIVKWMDGWLMLLRYFTERAKPIIEPHTGQYRSENSQLPFEESRFCASEYTDRRSSVLDFRWR